MESKQLRVIIVGNILAIHGTVVQDYYELVCTIIITDINCLLKPFYFGGKYVQLVTVSVDHSVVDGLAGTWGFQFHVYVT